MIYFWVFAALSTFWVADSESAKFGLEVKFSFFIVPLLFSLKPLSRKGVLSLMYAFILGNAVAGVLNMNDAVISYISSGKINSFIMKYFSDFIHPSYWGMYLLLSCIFCIHIISEKLYQRKWIKQVLWVLLIFFLLCIFLVQSKNVIIFSVMIPLIFIFRFVIKKKKWKSGFFALMILFAGLFVVFTFVPNLQDRFVRMYNSMTGNKAEDDPGTSYRLAAWKLSIDLIKEKPVLGNGIGQGKELLTSKLKSDDSSTLTHRTLDSHSQILTTWIETGLLGLVILLFMFIRIILKGYQKRNLLLILFSCLVFFSCLTESMFETQAGVLFFVFFALILSGPFPDHARNKI